METKHLSISIVTPTFNSERFLEAAICSIMEQEYPELEHIIIDGASTDSTLTIIRRYAEHLSYWNSEPDSGMYHAIQKGFEHTSGEIMGWLNSDDIYLPWTLHMVNQIFASLPEVEWISSVRPLLWNEQGFAVECMQIPGFTKKGFWRGEYMPGSRGFMFQAIQQESTFWRRSLWERAGGTVDTSLKLAGDFELWARFYQHAELFGVRAPIGGFRLHSAQLTASKIDLYHVEARAILKRYHGIEQGKLRSLLRQMITRIPQRLRYKVGRLGLLYPSQTVIYDLRRNSWKVRRYFI